MTIYKDRVDLSDGFYAELAIEDAPRDMPTVQFFHYGPGRDPDGIGFWGQLTSGTPIGDPIELSQRDIADLTRGLLDLLTVALANLKGLPPKDGNRSTGPTRTGLSVVSKKGDAPLDG